MRGGSGKRGLGLEGDVTAGLDDRKCGVGEAEVEDIICNLGPKVRVD